MTIKITRMKNKLHTLPLIVTFAALTALSACDSSTPDTSGNQAANDSGPGSNPSSSLTFATNPNAPATGNAQPGEGGLQGTLAETSVESLDDLQVLVYGPMCSGCHMGGGISQPSVMDMTTADATYASLVNQPSLLVAGSTLVVPGSSAQSHLMRTLEGTQSVGSRMPMRAAHLSPELTAAVRAWIDNGAQR